MLYIAYNRYLSYREFPTDSKGDDMVITNSSIIIQTSEKTDIVDITHKVKEKVEEARVTNGNIILTAYLLRSC